MFISGHKSRLAAVAGFQFGNIKVVDTIVGLELLKWEGKDFFTAIHQIVKIPAAGNVAILPFLLQSIRRGLAMAMDSFWIVLIL